MDKNQIVLGVVAFILVALILGVSIKSWKLGSDEKDFKEICVYGHTYYRANFSMKAMVAIKLDEKGLPVPCKRVPK